MVDVEALRALDPDAVILAVAGHNVQVEKPALLGRLPPAWQDSDNGIQLT